MPHQFFFLKLKILPMGLTWPQYVSLWGWTSGSPYTSDVLAIKTLAPTLLANPKKFQIFKF